MLVFLQYGLNLFKQKRGEDPLHRKPVVSGVFYSDNLMALRSQIEKLFLSPIGPGQLPDFPTKNIQKSFGLVLPHAGYVYSGSVSAWGIWELAKRGKPETILLIGPSHTGMGKPISIWNSGSWETPFGNIEVDAELADLLLSRYDYASADSEGHLGEHSLEVHIPMLQYIYGRDFRILPIAMMDQRKETALDLGEQFSYLKTLKPLLIIASTDLNHYEPENVTRRKDQEVIDAIASMNVEHLYSVISELNISMCGFGPTAALMSSGDWKPKLLKHATSGEISGDYERVVGYVSMLFE